MRAAEKDSEANHVARAGAEGLMAERASLSAGTEQAREERYILSARIQELEAAAATRDSELGFVVRAGRR